MNIGQKRLKMNDVVVPYLLDVDIGNGLVRHLEYRVCCGVVPPSGQK